MRKKLMPDTFEGRLEEARRHIAFVAYGKPRGLAKDIIVGRLMIAIESLIYAYQSVGGEVTDYLNGIIFEMFESGDNDDDEAGENKQLSYDEEMTAKYGHPEWMSDEEDEG